MKNHLKSSRVLVYFDDKLPLILSVDASPYGVGVVLSHKFPNGDEKPICFASRTLTPVKRKYSQMDKEALAILFGMKKYHQYLYRRHFELQTDHQPLYAYLQSVESNTTDGVMMHPALGDNFECLPVYHPIPQRSGQLCPKSTATSKR